MEQTVHNDEVGGALAEAMWLLETWLTHPCVGSGLPASAEEIGWTVHDVIQKARMRYVGAEEYAISPYSDGVISRIRGMDSSVLAGGGGKQ